MVWYTTGFCNFLTSVVQGLCSGLTSAKNPIGSLHQTTWRTKGFGQRPLPGVSARLPKATLDRPRHVVSLR